MDERLVLLAKLLRDQGDAVLSGAAKLSLQLEELVHVSKLFDQQINEEFVACQSSSSQANTILDFVQKTKAIKIVGGDTCELFSLKICKSLRYLELYNVPVEILCDVNFLKSTVRTIALNRSCSDLCEFLSSKDTSTVWKKLTKANFCFNNISVVFKPLKNTIPYIRYLDLSHNDIRQLDNALVGLQHLQTLKISFNLLEDIPILDSPCLKTLVARNNNIKMLDGFFYMKSVVDIDLRGNCLEYIEQLSPLAHFPSLEHLFLAENPISFNPKYRIGVLKELNHKINADSFFLDSSTVTLKEYEYLRTATSATISYTNIADRKDHDKVFKSLQSSDQTPINSFSSKAAIENILICKSPKKVQRVKVSSQNDDNSDKTDIVSDQTSEAAEIADCMVERYGDKWLSFFEGREHNNIVVDEDVELEKLTIGLGILDQSSSDESLEISNEDENKILDVENYQVSFDDNGLTANEISKNGFEDSESNNCLFDESNTIESSQDHSSVHESLLDDMIEGDDEDHQIENAVTKGTQHLVKLNNEDVFLLIHETMITEQDSIGQVLQTLDISCLENFLEDRGQKNIKLHFNHVSLSRKNRLYNFNTHDEMYSFLREIEAIWRKVRDENNTINEVLCINCLKVFPKSDSNTCSECFSEVLVPYTPSTSQSVAGQSDTSILPFDRNNDSLVDENGSTKTGITESSDISSATTHTDYSLYSANKFMFINQTNFVKADHKLELFFDVELFMRKTEVLCCYLFAQYAQYGRQKATDCVLVVSNYLVYMCKLRPNEKPSLKSRHRLSQLKHLDIGLNYQHFRLEWEIKDAAYKILVYDKTKCKNFIEIFTLALPKTVQLNQVSTSTINNIQELVFGIDKTFELFAKGKQYRHIMKNTVEGWGIKDRMLMFRTYENCFVGSELIDMMINEGEYNSRAEAVDVCHQMLLIDVLHHVKLEEPFTDDTTLYRYNIIMIY